MRKTVIRILMAAAVLALVLAGASMSYAADDAGYNYTVRVYAGAQGHFGSGSKVWEHSYAPGESVNLDLKELDFHLDNDEYYVRGIRETGHDNDTYALVQTSYSADEDTSYEVAYGIKGGMVSYVINYVDENGGALRASDTYYGMVGDKPVVSYKYVENYLPQSYSLGKTLTADESQNVFNFVYSGSGAAAQEADEDEEQTDTADGSTTANRTTANGTAANGGAAGRTTAGRTTAGAVTNPGAAAAAANGGAGGANGGANAGAAGNNNAGTADIGDADTPLADGPQQYTDLDDGKTPKADGQNVAHSNLVPILIGSAAGILILLALLLLFLKKRGEEDAEE